jgi:hypothetical protein
VERRCKECCRYGILREKDMKIDHDQKEKARSPPLHLSLSRHESRNNAEVKASGSVAEDDEGLPKDHLDSESTHKSLRRRRSFFLCHDSLLNTTVCYTGPEGGNIRHGEVLRSYGRREPTGGSPRGTYRWASTACAPCATAKLEWCHSLLVGSSSSGRPAGR